MIVLILNHGLSSDMMSFKEISMILRIFFPLRSFRNFFASFSSSKGIVRDLRIIEMQNAQSVSLLPIPFPPAHHHPGGILHPKVRLLEDNPLL